MTEPLDTTKLIERPDDDDPLPAQVTGSPERIWLQYGDIDRDCTHDECWRQGDVSWCHEPIFGSDVGYVRADALQRQAEEIERLRVVADAASVYYQHYMQDEADSPEYCACGDEQHRRACDVRDALKVIRPAAQGVKG